MKAKNLFVVSLMKFSKQIKQLNDFDSAMIKLMVISGKDQKDNKEVNNCIEWFRNEFVKRPEKYPGDNVVVQLVYKYAATGLTVSQSVEQTYSNLKGELSIIDLKRNFK